MKGGGVQGWKSTTMLDESESIDGWRIEAWTKNGYNHNNKEKTKKSRDNGIRKRKIER